MPNDNEQRPIVVKTARDSFWVYPTDNLYPQVAELERNADGSVEVSEELLSRAVGWWHDKAEERVRERLTTLEIPSAGDFRIAGTEDGNSLTQRLAEAGHWVSRITEMLADLDLSISLTKEAVEMAVNKALALQDSRAAVGPRAALILSSHPRLRASKLALIENQAMEKALRLRLEAFDIQWRTISRVLSWRNREPYE